MAGQIMSNQNLETLVNKLGLKTVVALLADFCQRRAEQTEAKQGLIEGKATDWRADGQTLRSVIARLKNP